MRTTVAVGMGVVMFFVGTFALSEAAQQSESTAMGTEGGAAAWNTSTGVFEGLATTAAPAIVWMGVAAIILVALAFLASSFGGGR